MATALDIVNQALKACGVFGVGQTPLAEDVNDGFTLLKQMIFQWQGRRWLVPSLFDIARTGNNLVSNPIGPGEFWDTTRPDKISAAYLRLNGTAGSDFNGDFNGDFGPSGAPSSSSVDYPLQQLFSYEAYSTIALKGLNSFPNYFFYDNQVPVGNVFIWPIPNAQYEIHLILKSPFTIPAQVTDTLIFADEYQEALWTNLAIRMCVAYAMPASKELVTLAKVSLDTIRNSNTQIPTLIVPAKYNNFGNGSYNVYSDTFGSGLN
jgi:hypothetical protein